MASSPPGSPPGVAPAPEERLAAAVAGCRDVVALSRGRFGEVATYLPGRRVAGVRMLDDSIEVHVVALWGTPLPAVAEQVRSACAPFAAGRRVDVTIADVAVAMPELSPPSPATRPTPHPTPHTTP